MTTEAESAPIESLPPEIKSIQPGGGVCMRIELAWGGWRRWYLKTFRKRYIADMLAKREGSTNACPHEVLDPRDVKFYRNQGGYYWSEANDPFCWRDRLPFVRAGLAELFILGATFFALTAILAVVFWPLAIAPALVGLSIVWFFRNPKRIIPDETGVVVSPADGHIACVEDVSDEFIGKPAVLIGIFLSVFDVHINRVSMDATVIGLRHRRGKFLNALRPESAQENERMEVRFQQNSAPRRRFIIRQIAGAIARRIVCHVAPGDSLEIGEQFGMIKLGSRTELIIPKEAGLELLVSKGQKVNAGATVLARYTSTTETPVSPASETASGEAT
ncbi:MAG: phosphatidylserine decarboxylase family protein [Planctomycetes bacterium]|nr:phosphatidylserine decarboxylase family protein [Planctomycetota bacterium]